MVKAKVVVGSLSCGVQKVVKLNSIIGVPPRGDKGRGWVQQYLGALL